MGILKPDEIEKRSFEIITSKMDKDRLKVYSDDELQVVKRAIHTTADFDYQYNMIFQNNALEVLKNCIKSEAMLFTDTTMALSGINKRLILDKYGIDPFCLIADEATVKMSKEQNITRSSAAIDLAYNMHITYNQERNNTGQGNVPIVFAVGNAPTALIRINELLDKFKPNFIIAAPVGFVNVSEAKELIKSSDIPAIVCDGNKGGSNVCAAIINAVLLQIH